MSALRLADDQLEALAELVAAKLAARSHHDQPRDGLLEALGGDER
ncbi:MAG: hypothetical protein ACP5H2_10475 [Solirubrobacteraceae bacterium]